MKICVYAISKDEQQFVQRFCESAKDADLQAYLTAVGADWKQPDPAKPGDPEATIPFDPAAAADWVWGRLDALNAA